MIKYKLTDANGKTQNNTHWEPGVTITATGVGTELCTDGVIHYTDSSLLAVLLNPIQANITGDLRLFEIEVEAEVAHDGLKGGTKSANCIREIPVPTITPAQRVRFAILCALQVYHQGEWLTWANNWLSGRDRDAAWAAAAARVAEVDANAAAAAVEAWVEAAAAAAAAWVDADAAAAWVDAAAAAAAAAAAWADKDAADKIDFAALARQAVEDER